jgi:hypothetical protein
MIEFKQTHVEIPGLITPGSKTNIEFTFEGDPSLISKVAPSCGCTADAKVEGNKVTALFTEQEAATVNKEHYQSGVYQFNKVINVFTTYQTTIKLTFTGNVLL